MAKDLTVEYFGNEDPREKENPVPEGANGECTDWSLPGDENQLVLFKPDKEGYYRFTYKNDELIVHVDYPEIGFYSNPNQNKDNLYSVNYLFDNSVNDYTGLIEDNQSTIYVNLYNRYSDPVTLKACELTLWDEEITLKGNYDEKLEPAESEDGSTTVDGKDITNYMSVEPESDNEGWYKITFNEDLCLEGGFDLRIVAEKQYEDGNSDSLDAWLSGSFIQSGLYVTCDEEGYGYNGGESLTYPGGIVPDTAELKFGEIVQGENGKIEYTPLSLKLEKEITIQAQRSGEDKLHEVTDDDCEYVVTDDGTLKISSYYQQDYVITVGEKGTVRVRPYMETIEFLTTDTRTADADKIENRIREIEVKEGTSKTVYVLAFSDENGPGFAPAYTADMNTAEIKAVLKDGKTEVADYIKKGEKQIIDENGYVGYSIEITDKAEKDFDIIVTANGYGVDERGVVLTHTNTLSVKINKRSSLQVTPPTKTVYTESETFDPTGMTVEVV